MDSEYDSTGIYIQDSEATIRDSLFRNNTRNIHVAWGPEPVLENNSFE